MFWLYSNFLMFWLYLYLYRYHKYRLCIENWYKTNDISKSCRSLLLQPQTTHPHPPHAAPVRRRAPCTPAAGWAFVQHQPTPVSIHQESPNFIPQHKPQLYFPTCVGISQDSSHHFPNFSPKSILGELGIPN